MTDGIEDAYARFLSSADVDTWERCMDQAAAVVAALPEDDERAGALARALCITMYLQWLGRVSGDARRTERARMRFCELQDEVRRFGAASAPQWRTCWGLLLAAAGFRKHAATFLARDGHVPPEHALWLFERSDVKALAVLRRLVAEASRTPFPPLAFEFGLALVSIGEIREARTLAEATVWDTAEPFKLEILASAGERLGEWADAYAAYRSSSWPIHRYRAAMVGAISGHLEAVDDLEMDEPMRQYLSQLDGDLDQAGIARCSAFLDACLWHPVDDWRVQLELGTLSFRRRQYAEADLHLIRAARSAPREARFAIAQVRFFDLTWLTSDELPLPLDMYPEALAAGQEALRHGSDADNTSVIRTWMAGRIGDLALIPESIDGWEPSDRADAYLAIGDTGRAVDCLLESLESRYNHRSVQQLIRLLYPAGFEEAAWYLTDLVFRESADDFLGLWETALTLHHLVPASAEADARDELERWQDQFRARLIELSRFEFMNSLRSYRLATVTNHQDLAEEMLQRAARQAEGVSELLAVAVLRRMIRAARPVRSDQDGLWCLMRARSLARDRLERLQVARELLYYGFGGEARAILSEEGTFHPDTRLSHSEMVVVLQCGPVLTEEERAGLAHSAAVRLSKDRRSGALGKYPATFASRLLAAVQAVDEPLSAAIAESLDPALLNVNFGTAWPGRFDDDWPTVRGRIDEAAADSSDDAQPSLDTWLGVTGIAPSFGLRVMVTSHLRTQLEALIDEARRVLPALPAERIPIAKSADRGDGVRTILLCDLWRTRLTAPPAEADPSAARLREFFDAEQQLLDEWEADRRSASRPTLRRVVRVGQALEESLTRLIGPDQRAYGHPVLRALFEKLDADTQSLRAEAAEQVSSALRELDEVDAQDGVM